MSQDLTANGKPWGWFTADGKPVATGDDWHRWVCPKAEWQDNSYECEMSGEWIAQPSSRVPCPVNRDAGPGREQCTRCSNVFVYPRSPAAAEIECAQRAVLEAARKMLGLPRPT